MSKKRNRKKKAAAPQVRSGTAAAKQTKPEEKAETVGAPPVEEPSGPETARLSESVSPECAQSSVDPADVCVNQETESSPVQEDVPPAFEQPDVSEKQPGPEAFEEPSLPDEPETLAAISGNAAAAARVRPRRRHIGFWAFMAFTAVFAAASAMFIFLLFNFSGSTLFRSPADVELPNFYGMQLSDVEDNPEYRSFDFVVEEQFNTEYDEGVIFAQSPKAPKLVKENATITLRVSKGIQHVEVPSVADLTADEAKDLLEESGLSVVVRYVEDEEIEDGYAIRTDPEEGEKTLGGNTVTLYVSREDNYERVDVPNCVGKSESEAKKLLQAKGFSVSVIEKESSKSPGTVISMSPSETAIAGTTVTITVSKGSQEYNGGDHVHDLQVVQVIPPSATGYGYTLYRCSICGLETTGDQVPPTG